jgi:hypothetical protein
VATIIDAYAHYLDVDLVDGTVHRGRPQYSLDARSAMATETRRVRVEIADGVRVVSAVWDELDTPRGRCCLDAAIAWGLARVAAVGE